MLNSGARQATTRGLLVALVVVASTQRFSLAEVPPLTSMISDQTGLNALGLGMATTLTVVMMAIGSPLSAQLTHRVSREWILVWGAAAVTVGCLVRAVPPLAVTLFVGSEVGGLGIAAVGTMIPGVIAERLPGRVGVAVGATNFSFSFIAIVVSSLTVPLAARIGVTWALAAWAVPALLAMLIWLPFALHSTPTPGGRTRMPWASRSAWLTAALLTGENIVFLVALAWIAPSFQARGLSADEAGFLLGAVTIGGMLGAVATPMLSQFGSDRRPVLLLTVAISGAGGLYLAFGATALAWPAMVLLGCGFGGGFGVAIALLIDLGDSPRSTAALSAMTFLIAYLASAPSAAIGGWIRDLSGGFTAVWWLVVATSVILVPISLALGPKRARSVHVG
ncbi:MAG: MFS transporter [Actinomycetes bacterium]